MTGFLIDGLEFDGISGPAAGRSVRDFVAHSFREIKDGDPP
jgi:hypothetical protein